MNSSQNYIAEKSVFPPKIVANFSETSEKEKGTENQEKFDEHKPNGAFKIFYESNFFANDSRVEKNFKRVKKKRCRDSAHREITEDRKRIRKNQKKTEPDIFTDPKTSSNIPILIPHSAKHKTEKNLDESEKLENKPVLNYIKKCDALDETHISTAVPQNNAAEKKPEEVTKPKDFSFPITQKQSNKSAHKSQMKPTISDIGKRHINEILKSHAQRIREKASLTKKNSEASKSSDLRQKVSQVTEKEQPSNINVKHEKPENRKLEEKNSKAVEKPSKESKKDKESLKSSEALGEEKKKLPSTWANVPQSNELERRLKNSGQQPVSLFLNKKGQKKDEEELIRGEEKQLKVINADDNPKGKQKSANVEDSSKRKQKSTNAEENQKEDGTKIEKRETYTDRLLLLKMMGKDLEDKKRAIEINEEHNRLINVEKTQDGFHRRTPTFRRHLPDIMVKPVISKEALIEAKEHNPIKIEKIIEAEGSLKTERTRSTELKDMVAQAIKDHKIFCIFDNHTYIVRPVREELLNRGWMEIIPDRRLIPRRRPPPMGPVLEKTPDKTSPERNLNTIEAILAAKQNFADELQETVYRSPSFKYTIEQPKVIATAVNCSKRKASLESVHEVKSQFCIVPPNYEKKKSNIDIREFVAKYNAILQKVKERENDIKKLREKEKNAKIQKRDKLKPPNEKSKREELPVNTNVQIVHPPLSTKKSIQKIIDSINDNNKILINVVTEIGTLEEMPGGNLPLGVLNDAKQKAVLPAKHTDHPENEKQDKPPQENTNKTVFTENEARAISKIIQAANARIHFMWLSIKPGIHLKCFNYSPEIINKFQRTTFCTKIGLWSHLSNLQWYAHEVSYPAKSPRMYNTGEADDLQAFFKDFQLTACIGMLKWISDTFFEKGLKGVHAKRGKALNRACHCSKTTLRKKNGEDRLVRKAVEPLEALYETIVIYKVPLKAFDFAIKQCEKYIRYKENEDLTAFEDFNVLEEEWNTFLKWFYNITNDQGRVQESSTAQLMYTYTRAAETLKIMRRYWPEMDIDGRLNIWIMKPYCASCGRGIFMTNNVYYIGQHSKYIVQKYIEKPLLIYNTKFDIRQWFMITKLTPLEVWMYKECYLRFCSQPFALRNLHESVHLSNNSVQRKYISVRDPTLPDQNMWDSKTFQLYLRTIGQPNVWEEVIYPGMRDAIVSTMLSAQETFDGPRKSWFEVYGADFMLSSNLRDGPWLIEINENPAMDPSTKVTARLCPQMLRDVIKGALTIIHKKNFITARFEEGLNKFVVDRKANKNASTGQWELVYRQNFSASYGVVNLDVKGRKIAKNVQPARIIADFPTSKTFPNEKKEPFNPGKLYDFVHNFDENQNTGGSSSYFEKFRNRRKLIQIKRENEPEPSAKTTNLLRKFKEQATTDEIWDSIILK